MISHHRKLTMMFALSLLMLNSGIYADRVAINQADLQPVNASLTVTTTASKDAVRVIKDPAIEEFDEPTFARLRDVRFKDGIIEVKALSTLLTTAPEFARGFIGVAFRISDDNSKFECIYVRPSNARADNQVRRNHSIQYFAYPDYKFQRLRKESPEKYESYADMALDEWIDLKIEVKDASAKLYVNGSPQPALVVNDLKHGPDVSGGVALWVDVGTEGYFSDIKVRNDN